MQHLGIDKTSSAELSEAINSMYEWYRQASICYVYLADVTILSEEENDNRKPFDAKSSSNDENEDQDSSAEIRMSPNSPPRISEAFESSRWFSRGWTLQELIAPTRIEFYDRNWTPLGLKSELTAMLAKITRIPEDVLLHHRPTSACSIAMRMSWASSRRTTRIEDEAYCLMGIFGIHMPLLYGEQQHAFIRLQKEMIGQSSDQSIFAWQMNGTIDASGNSRTRPQYLAPSTANLAHSAKYKPISRSIPRPPHTINDRGLEIATTVIYGHKRNQFNAYAILNCFDSDFCTRRLLLQIWPSDDSNPERATEFKYGCTLTTDDELIFVRKATRRITILNGDSENSQSSVELRVRCFARYEWKSMPVPAGELALSEEISLNITNWSPVSSWDSSYSIFKLNRSNEQDSKQPSWSGFAGKISYTCGKCHVLGRIPSEKNIVVHLRLNQRGRIEANLTFMSTTSAAESLTQDLSREPTDSHELNETGTSLHDVLMHGWIIRLVHIKPTHTDPYDTLGIDIATGRQWKLISNNFVAFASGLKTVLAQTLLNSRKGSRMSFRTIPIDNYVPELELRQLYGGRKRWRQVRGAEFVRWPMMPPGENEKETKF